MQKIVCELCGSNDLAKVDGVFVCQYCGCKYTLEEAKKLMVSGVVEIDRSQEARNILKNANVTYDGLNFVKAYDLYTEVLNIDPDNEEAIMMRGFSSGWQSTAANCNTIEAEKSFNRAVEMAYQKYGNSKLFFDFYVKGARNYGALLLGISTLFKDYQNKMGQAVEKNKDMQNYCYFKCLSIWDSVEKLVTNFENADENFFDVMTLLLTDSYAYYKQGRMDSKCIVKDQIEKINQIKNGLRLKRYWDLHQEEKRDLENQKTQIQEALNDIRLKIESCSENEESKKISQSIIDLINKRKELSFWDNKAKKQIDLEIKTNNEKIRKLNESLSQVKKSLTEQEEKLSNQLNDIEMKLMRGRS